MDLFSSKEWRSRCGTVMQDGFIFSDTIVSNIGISDEIPKMEKVRKAARLANISDYIESLPMGYKTKVGIEGMGLSSGQKQRLLIARAIYKDADLLVLDEATNSLDANNEQEIISNLKTVFENKTVIIAAHRLSTVKYADNIIVLNDGIIKEYGKHDDLLSKRGEYYRLVKNQLSLSD